MEYRNRSHVAISKMSKTGQVEFIKEFSVSDENMRLFDIVRLVFRPRLIWTFFKAPKHTLPSGFSDHE